MARGELVDKEDVEKIVFMSHQSSQGPLDMDDEAF